MPRIDELTLVLSDAALRVVGALVIAWAAFRLIRGGAWRDPLDTRDFRRQGVTILEVAGVFVLYVLLSVLLVRLFRVLPANAPAPEPGSHSWHVLQGIDTLAKLVCSALMIRLLLRTHVFPAPFFGRRVGKIVLLACGTTLAILPLAFLQLQAGQIIWYWINPAAQPPIHDVLKAFEQSAWGGWGKLHLIVAAVVVAPLAEELFFRGMLLEMIWGYAGHAWIAIVLTGVAFGLIHQQQPQDVLPLATMGIILGYVRVRYRSLSVCVLTHALFNARTILMVLLNPDLARQTW